MKLKKQHQGFSLIELSIVILIIGLLIIGISKGSRIIKEARLKSAIALTNGSPLHSMEGLVFWLDTTDKNNIATNSVYGVVGDNDDVNIWRDRNSQSVNRMTISALTGGTSNPKYIANGINGLPTIKFDGVDDGLASAGGPLALGDDDYTMIMVWRSFNALATQVLLEQRKSPVATASGSAVIWTESTSSIKFAFYANDTASFAPEILKKDYITTFTINNSNVNNVTGYINSNTGLVLPTANNTTADLGNYLISIGTRVTDSPFGFHSNPFNGYISEVIIFDRVLKASEVKSINTYLSQKYSIKLN